MLKFEDCVTCIAATPCYTPAVYEHCGVAVVHIALKQSLNPMCRASHKYGAIGALLCDPPKIFSFHMLILMVIVIVILSKGLPDKRTLRKVSMHYNIEHLKYFRVFFLCFQIKKHFNKHGLACCKMVIALNFVYQNMIVMVL